MGATVAAPVPRRAAAPARDGAGGGGRPAAPVGAGTPNFLEAVQRRGAAGSRTKSRIDAETQRVRTDDRREAEALAERIGQPEARDAMRAQEAREAARRVDAAHPGDGTAARPAVPPPVPLPDAVPRRSEPAEGGAAGAAPAGGRAGDGRAAGAGTRTPGAAGGRDGGAGRREGDAAPGGPAGARAETGGEREGEGEGEGEGQAGAEAQAETGGPAGGAGEGAPGGRGRGRGGGGASQLVADPPRAAAGAEEPQSGAGDMETGELVLIDLELAEHQRWAGALGRVGEVGSIQRAAFIAESAGGGFIGGVASGGAMALGIGLATRAVPVLGPIVGGGMALHGLLGRDWDATAATVGRFGEGADAYDTLANSLAAVSAVIDVVSEVLGVIGGIVGVVEAVAIGVAAGAGVLAFFTFGATAGVAIAAGELALTCEEIREGITIVTTALDLINSALLNPCIVLFRALHAFTTQADPREVEADGGDLSSAAAASGSALGSWVGGRASQAGARARPAHDDGAPTRQRPPHEAPPAAAGDGPQVRFRPAAEAGTAPAGRPRAPVEEIAASPGRRVVDEGAAAAAPARVPEQLSLPGIDAAAVPAGRPPPAAAPAPAPGPHPVTPDVEIRGSFRGVALERPGDTAAAGDIARHRLQGTRGDALISEHVIPGAQMRDASVDPAHGAPDWERSRASGSAPEPGRPPAEHDAPDYRNATTIVEHAAVAARKTEADNAATRALQQRGGPVDPVQDLLLPSLQRHQRAVDEAVAAGEITPAQATDPVHRALAAQAEMWSLGEASGGAAARARAEAGGPRVTYPRRADRQRAAEARRRRDRLAGERIEDIDWNATFPDPNRLAPPGTQLPLPGMEHLAPRPAAAPPEQLSFPGFDRPPAAPGQLELPFGAPQGRTGADTPLRIGEGRTRGGEPLTPGQFGAHAEAAAAMGMPREQIHQAQGDTSYHPGYDALLIGPDIHPLPPAQRPGGLANPANAALEPQAVLGHEVIGHREAALGGQTRDDVWHEELQASARAAIHTPGLSREQSWLLLQDAAARRRFQTREGEIYVDTGRYGPAAAPQARGGGRGPGDEPSVVVDWQALGLAPPALAGAPAPGSATPPVPLGPAPPAGQAPGGYSGVWAAGAREGRTATTEALQAGAAPGGPQAGDGEPGWGTRARQAGALFVPQLFSSGGPAPTYAEQRAAHRARFADDDQPAEGVERIDPGYAPPPATPAQIVAIQNEILNLLAVRARAEREALYQDERVDACRANRAPIERTMADTRAGLSAVAAHEAAVARRDAVNQEQQRRQQEAAGLTAGYPDRATGLAVLSVPLAAWEGFTSLASHLPGSAGDRMAEMNAEAQRMQAAFDQMGAQMLGVDGEQPARQGELQGDAERIDRTDAQAQTSEQRLQTADEGAAGLHAGNEATLAEARRLGAAATRRGEALAQAAAEREQRATSLAGELRVWAVMHRAQRARAVAATAVRLEAEGNVVTQRSGE